MRASATVPPSGRASIRQLAALVRDPVDEQAQPQVALGPLVELSGRMPIPSSATRSTTVGVDAARSGPRSISTVDAWACLATFARRLAGDAVEDGRDLRRRAGQLLGPHVHRDPGLAAAARRGRRSPRAGPPRSGPAGRCRPSAGAATRPRRARRGPRAPRRSHAGPSTRRVDRGERVPGPARSWTTPSCRSAAIWRRSRSDADSARSSRAARSASCPATRRARDTVIGVWMSCRSSSAPTASGTIRRTRLFAVVSTRS